MRFDMCHTNNQRSFVIKVQIKSNFGRTDTSRHGKPARLDIACALVCWCYLVPLKYLFVFWVSFMCMVRTQSLLSTQLKPSSKLKIINNPKCQKYIALRHQ